MAGQSLNALAVDHAVPDEPHGPGHHVGPHVPFRRTRRRIGPAAQAGTKSSLMRRGRRSVKAHVLALGRARWTARAAVDARRLDTAKDPTVKARIAELEHLLERHLDTRVKVDLKGRRGRVMIEFADLDDLERIYRAMLGDGGVA